MESKQFTLKAKTPKNQAILNRTIKALVRYNNLNNQRDKADDSGDEKLYRKLNKQCEVAFDKYLELADELPKYEKDRLENSDVYLHYAKGGKTKKGKKEPMIVRSYFEDEAIDYAKGGSVNKKKHNLEVLEGQWQSYYKGVMGGQKDDGYITIKNEDDLQDYIESKLGKVVGSIKLLEKGKRYPYNRSNPYSHDTYLVTLKNGQEFNLERQYGVPNWSGNVDYTERISVDEVKFAKGGEVDLSGNNYRVLFTKKDSDIVYGEEIYAKSENEARKKFNNKHKGKGRTIEYISTPSAYYSDGGKMEDSVVRKGDYWIVKNQGNTDFPFLVNSRDGAIVYKAESKKDATDWIKQRSDEYEDDEITTGFNYSIGGL